ncbi:MAG: L,D-transpeptidase family protein, partial [Psychromonas sp.]|nr:L,D-transpeptidase family protein [Psychromonas sp.]
MRRYCHSLSLWIENSYTLKQKAILNAISCLFTIIVIIPPIAATATEYSIPENGSRLIGVTESYKVGPGDYFQTIARFYNIGLIALMESNPGIDPLLPPLGTELKIPTQMLLPDVPYRGIVINLPEFRLYYFPKGTNKVHVFPVGIGRVNRPTPIMNSRIKSKIKNPSWTPNARIKADYFSKYGKELPSVIPPGEN